MGSVKNKHLKTLVIPKSATVYDSTLKYICRGTVFPNLETIKVQKRQPPRGLYPHHIHRQGDRILRRTVWPKNTNDLLDQLADNNCSIDDYLEENREDMIVLAAKDFWEAAIERSGMSKCNIINKADFNYCYFYDIVNGRKIASRDKVIRLILSMHLTTDDCQEALRISGRSALYPKVQRDALLIYGIENRYTVDETNQLLSAHGEDTLR